MTDARAVAQQYIDHIAALRYTEAFNMLAQDSTYTVIGTTAGSGTFLGRDNILAGLQKTLAGFKKFPVASFQPPIVDGERVVLLATTRGGEGPTGPYEQPHLALVLRIKDGQITECVEFLDTCRLETGVFGRKLVAA